MNAIDRLLANINSTKNPSVAGLDPTWKQLPDFLKQDAIQKYGKTSKAAAEAIFQFNIQIMDAIHEEIPAVKLQMACYEVFGHHGIRVFEESVQYANKLGLAVIADGKRNDISSTAKLYADALLTPPILEDEPAAFLNDYLTINPYLGKDGIQPFLDTCKQEDRGVFILVKTSNPSGGDYQDLNVGDQKLYEKIAADVEVYAQQLMGEHRYSSVGAVVGATWPEEAAALRVIMPSVYFLVPGYGAQGGTADQVTHSFNPDGYGALVNSSRGIIFSWEKYGMQETEFAQSALNAVKDMKEDLVNALNTAGKLPSNW